MRLTAIAVAPVVAAGLVIAPHTSYIAVPPSVPTTQPQTLAVELTSAALHINTETTTPARAAAATPKASASGPDVTRLATAALLIALTPLWYAAFPISLPATVAIVYFAEVAVSCISACGVGVDPVAAVKFGITAWAAGPLELIQSALKGIVPQASSTVAASRTPATAKPSTASRQNRGASKVRQIPVGAQTPVGRPQRPRPPGRKSRPRKLVEPVKPCGARASASARCPSTTRPTAATSRRSARSPAWDRRCS